MIKIGHLNSEFIKANTEDKHEIIMSKANIKIDIDHIVDIEECNIELELMLCNILLVYI